MVRSSAQIDDMLAGLVGVADPECPSILLHVMQLVENLDTPPPSGAAKKQLVLDKIAALLPVVNNEQDLRRLGKTIDFLCELKLVSKLTTAAVVSASACSYLQKKFHL